MCVGSLLFQSNLPSIFWSYALIHSVVLINCIYTPFLGNKTPYEILYGTLYDITLLRVFGCLCFTSTIIANKKKLNPRAATSVFLGFKPNTKGYVTLNLKTRAISVSRNVIFYEDYFPFTVQNKPDPIIVLLVSPSSLNIDQFGDFPWNHQLIIILPNLLPLFLILILHKETLKHLEDQ